MTRHDKRMTPAEVRAAIEAQTCPFCGKGPFIIVAGHTQRAHGIDRYELRDLAGLYYSTSITPPEHAAERAQAARKHLVPLEYSQRSKTGSKQRESTAGLKAKYRFTEEDRRKRAEVGFTEAAREKQLAVHPPRHGSRKRYERGGCRCDLCRARNAARSRSRRARLADGDELCPRAYNSSRSAKLGARGAAGRGEIVTPYRCDRCQRWHLRTADGEGEAAP